MKKMPIKTIFLAYFDKTKTLFKKLFIASESDPKLVRPKHIRLGTLIGVIFIAICIMIMQIGSKNTLKASSNYSKNEKIKINNSGLESLAKGVTNEQSWTEIRGKEVDEIRNKQIESDQF